MYHRVDEYIHGQVHPQGAKEEEDTETQHYFTKIVW
jgi:hypothetical protein